MATVLEVIRMKIREEMNRITDETINGSCPDFPAYRFVCGIAYGLSIAESVVKETEVALMQGHDDEE